MLFEENRKGVHYLRKFIASYEQVFLKIHLVFTYVIPTFTLTLPCFVNLDLPHIGKFTT